MLRNRLRTLEQQVNAAEMPEDVKVKLQAYVSGCYGSLTSFTGRYLAKGERDGLGDSSRERIEAQWHLARLYDDDDPGKPHAMWETFIANSAVWYWAP